MTDEATAPAPDPERLISDVETLRALSDPLRLRIIEAMVQRVDPPWTVKELASALDVPQTRLYHHVELLLERDLIRAVERRVVQGIIETRYAVAARSFRLDRRLFQGGSPEADAQVHEVLLHLFDLARDELEASIGAGLALPEEEAPDSKRTLLSKGLLRLRADRAAELRSRLTELLAAYDDDDAGPDTAAYGLLVALYPLAPTGSVSSSGDGDASDV
ncbi:MAG TPA: helix-turn-helix domain-containing protein [Candidatus Limnocylindrales bacterium]|nr:helix-turn-helix domain-containing protein [Candidatus Limnocylindrales bacterium]